MASTIHSGTCTSFTRQVTAGRTARYGCIATRRPNSHGGIMSVFRFRRQLSFGFLLLTSHALAADGDKAPGYRGVWYSIAQGKKVAYSGGLGFYPPHIRPNAVYAAKARK